MRGVRTMQWVGIVLVVGSAFWPTLRLEVFPTQDDAPTQTFMASLLRGNSEVPAQELGTAVVESVRGPEHVEPLWEARRWYPWYLAPLWVLALLTTAGAGLARRDRRRRLVGGLLLLLTGGLIAFEAAYLREEYLSFLPGLFGRIEGACAWFLVVAVLLYRRRQDRHLGALEATLGAQALLGFVHALTLPATMLRIWLPGRELGAVGEAVLHNFRPAFWVGSLGLLLVALPVYLRRSGDPSAGIRRVDS